MGVLSYFPVLISTGRRVFQSALLLHPDHLFALHSAKACIGRLPIQHFYLDTTFFSLIKACCYGIPLLCVVYNVDK